MNLVNMSYIWDGDGVTDDRDVLTCPMARFTLIGARRGDVVELTRGNITVRCAVLKVMSDESLVFQSIDRTQESEQSPGIASIPPGDVGVVLTRRVEKPCAQCPKGSPRELDHLHCAGCNTVVEYNESGIVNCDECINSMIAQLCMSTHVSREVPLFKGKKTISIHARTVSECDSIQEWQDSIIIDNRTISTQYVLDESKKASVAFAVDDDGNGNNPRQLLDEADKDIKPAERVNLMMKHFKGHPVAYFNAIMTAVGQLDSVVEDACKYAIKDAPTEEELMLLGEQIAIGPYPVLGKVGVWDDKITLTFTSPMLEAVEDANAFAENFIQAHKDKMLEGRAKYIFGLAMLAVHFRGDHMRQFKEDSTFGDRLNYLLTLPMALYYLYLAAGNIWQHRVHKASGADILGKY